MPSNKKPASKNPKPKKIDPQVGREIGGSGTIIVGGYLSGQDYLTNLTGSAGIKVYDEMRKGDATVAATFKALKLPILAANWYVQPASDDPAHIEQADFVEENRTDMDITWQDLLNQALLYLAYGRMAFEIVYEVREDGKIGWKTIAPRLPQTIFKWSLENGEPGIVQFLPTGGSPEIPMDKLLVFVNEKEGDNWEGISTLRSAYQHWYYKKTIYKVQTMSIEKQGMGIPVIHIPENATPEDETRADNIGKNIRANEQAYVRLKGEKWSVEFMDMKGHTVKDAEPAIIHHDRQISKNILAQFLELSGGSKSSTGSHALAKSQTDLFLLALNAVARHMSDVFNGAVKKLIDLNYPNTDEYPEIDFNTIGREDMDILSNALLRLSQAGLITADPGLEQWLRETMELPEVPEGTPEANDLLDTMNEIESKSLASPGQFDPLGSTSMVGDEGGSDPADPEGNDKLTGHSSSPIHSKLKKLVAEQKVKLLQMKNNGKLDPEQVKALHVELLKAKAGAMHEMSKLKASEKTIWASEAKTRIDDAITAIEQEIKAA